MEPVTRRRWQLRGPEADAEVLQRLHRELDVGSLAGCVLQARGMDVGAARDFLEAGLRDLPDPHLLLDMEAAVSRLARALDAGEPILVHGDYDVDGISGTALLVENLRRFGGRVDYHIPLRLRDGYGLSAAALERAAAAGFRVVLSVDCGICAQQEARLAKRLGIDLIITDHHQPPPERPEALAVVNPHRPDDPFPDKNLAGVGVAFMLLVALRAALRRAGAFAGRTEPDLRESLDLVALGTIADLVPLQGVNRMLVRAGLRLLEGRRRPGIVALREVSGVQRVTCGSVGFQLAPRLNAAGRLEDAALGVELLLEEDRSRALETAGQLDVFNRERRRIEEQTLDQALEKLGAQGDEQTHSIVLGDPAWHPGVIGIVASRLVDRFHRPTVLIALDGDEGRGSARSIPGLHLYRALADCREALAGFGGHEFAAGLSLSAHRLDEFAAAFEDHARSRLAAQDLVPTMTYDAEILIEELSAAGVAELARLAPFGIGNPEPVFAARGVRPCRITTVGREHLKFTARQDAYSLPCIGWRLAERRDLLEQPVDLLFTPEFNEWKGRRTLQLRIRDLQPAQG